MNNIGFGIFCFGEDKYTKGTINKIEKLIENEFHCYVLTDIPDKMSDIKSKLLTIIPYYRTYKSYSDKMLLPKYMINSHDIMILLDADSHVYDFTIFEKLKDYEFSDGITYIDTLLNHRARKQYVKELIDYTQLEWEPYVKYATRICPDFGDFEAIWEYFLVINKKGFNYDWFYYYFERLQLMKEYSDLPRGKKVNGAGEGISIQISSKLSNTNIVRDENLYKILEGKIYG